MNNLNITGTLRSDDSGQNYTFSVKAFKEWKRRFSQAYLSQYGTSFKMDLPDSSQRESVYKTALNMKGIDIFQNGHTSVSKIPESMYSRVLEITKILNSH